MRLPAAGPLLALCAACAPASPGPQAIRTEDQASGTRALLIAVSPVDERVVWASGSQGTWLRTTDGGEHWEAGRVPGADTLQFRDVHALDASTAYLLSIGNGDQSRIYRTSDGGRSWVLQFTNPEPEAFYDCMDFWDARRGIVIGDAVQGRIAILTTEDAGGTWRRVPEAALPPAQAGEGSFAASGTCLVTRPGGRAWIVMSNPDHARVLRTTDFGRSWAIDTLPITTRAGVGPQSIDFRDDGNGVVLGGGYAAEPSDVLAAATGDGGRSWMPRAGPPMASGAWGGVYVPGARRPTLVAVGPAGSAWSADEGVTWARIDTLNYWSVGFASPRAGWAVGANGRITRLSGF